MICYYTSVNCAYVPRARILAKTIKKHNPHAKVCLVLCDDMPKEWGSNIEPFDIILTINDLEIPVQNLNLWIFKHTVREICTAVKGQAILKLFKSFGADKVIYMDPDTAVFDNLNEIEELLDTYDAILTPHITSPVKSEKDILEVEHPLLTAGLYNLGFIAIKNNENGLNIATYWRDRLIKYCYDDYATEKFLRGLYADQKWCSLLPVLFENINILKHPGYNVARWNYSEREISYDDNKYFINGRPLKFFHFSYWETAAHEGFKSDMNDWYTIQSRVDENLKKLSIWYEEENKISMQEYPIPKGYKFVYNYFSNGDKITDHQRLLLRDNIDIWNKFQNQDPFYLTEDRECYYTWYKINIEGISKEKIFQEAKNNINKSSEIGNSSCLKNSLLIKFKRLYNNLPMSDVNKCKLKNLAFKLFSPFIKDTFLYKQWKISRTLPDDIGNKDVKIENIALEGGINITGFIKGEFGTAHSARIFINAALEGGIPISIINSNIPIPHNCNDTTYDDLLQSCFNKKATLWCYNADMVPVSRQYIGNENWMGRYNIGLWYWELPDFPNEWVDSFEPLDEIWVTSKFTYNSISKKSTKPVYYIPMAISMNDEKITSDRSIFGLPKNVFLFITMYDVFSINERKNPKATIKAFMEAFDKFDMNVGLVIKINNPEANEDEVRELKNWISGFDNIYIIAKTLEQEEVYSLINSCDVLISLHRSEGFGLSLAEAMYLGKPVIGTNWSGNVDFMNEHNSCLVDYSLVNLGKDYGPYKAYQHWAEPNISHAAEYMKRLYFDPEYYKFIAKNGKDTIRMDFSPSIVGAKIKQRLIDLELL